MLTLDLQDACFCQIIQHIQMFIRFAIITKQGIFHCQFHALQCGLSAAPRIFTNIPAEVMSHLLLQGISLIPCLDNILLYASIEEKVMEDLQKVLPILKNMVLLINKKKILSSPDQIFLWLLYQLGGSNDFSIRDLFSIVRQDLEAVIVSPPPKH